jgi:hypothetical protein
LIPSTDKPKVEKNQTKVQLAEDLIINGRSNTQQNSYESAYPGSKGTAEAFLDLQQLYPALHFQYAKAAASYELALVLASCEVCWKPFFEH